MPRGHEDWSINTSVFGANQQDDSELAARLGSSYVWSRSGRVVFMDDFNDSLIRWDNGSTVSGGELTLSHKRVLSGTGSCKFKVGTGGSDVSGMTKDIPLIKFTKHGLEFLVRSDSDQCFFDISLLIAYNDKVYTYTIRLDYKNTRIYYLNSLGGYTLIADGIDFINTLGSWQYCKLVVNGNLDEYLYFQIDENYFDLGGISGDDTPVLGVGSSIGIRFLFYGSTPSNDVLYMNNVSYSIDEP